MTQTDIRFTLLLLGAVFNLNSKCYRMPPVCQSEHQCARAAAALGQPLHRLLEADVERLLEAMEQLHHKMRMMREMLQVYFNR